MLRISAWGRIIRVPVERLSPRTVHHHVAGVLAKLGADSRAAGLLRPAPPRLGSLRHRPAPLA